MAKIQYYGLSQIFSKKITVFVLILYSLINIINSKHIIMADKKTITVGNKCSIDYEANKVVFNPDSGVMKASYSYYSFPKSDFSGVDL